MLNTICSSGLHDSLQQHAKIAACDGMQIKCIQVVLLLIVLVPV